MSVRVLAYCELCGRAFYTASSARKLCDVPTCRGYLRHIDRRRAAREASRG